eukprot:jgi/Galph1/3769/GphlegSOOS_G2417.1
MAARACLGTLIGILFIFVPSLYSAFPDAPLALIYYIINLTFFVQELHFGIVVKASCLTAVALVFGACFGAVAALAARANIAITIVLAAIGTALFTILHSDVRVSGMVYYTGESNFVFNLLDTRTLGNSSILYTMRITLVASGLSIVFSLIPAILVFPKFSSNDMKLSIRDSLFKLGSSVSCISSILLYPYLYLNVTEGASSARVSDFSGSSAFSSSRNKALSSSSSDSSLDHEDNVQGTSINWPTATRAFTFLERILEGVDLLSAQVLIKRARNLAGYCIFEPNLVQFLRREPLRIWLRIIDAIEDLISKIDSIRSVIEGGRRRYKAETLERWSIMLPTLENMYARIATACAVLGSCICNETHQIQLSTLQNIEHEILNMAELQEEIKRSVSSAYHGYWDNARALQAESTAVELGPLMFVLVMSQSIQESFDNILEEFKILVIARKEKSLRRGYLNLFGWMRSFFWSFEVWFNAIKNIPRSRTDLQALTMSLNSTTL